MVFQLLQGRVCLIERCSFLFPRTIDDWLDFLVEEFGIRLVLCHRVAFTTSSYEVEDAGMEYLLIGTAVALGLQRMRGYMVSIIDMVIVVAPVRLPFASAITIFIIVVVAVTVIAIAVTVIAITVTVIVIVVTVIAIAVVNSRASPCMIVKVSFTLLQYTISISYILQTMRSHFVVLLGRLVLLAIF